MLSRRDRFPGDWVEINLDSYFDRRTAFSFTLSLSGTRGDELISGDGNRWDTNWDSIWAGATHADDEGWTAEMRIPLSQLRFSGAEEQTWSLQVQRRIFRHEERSTWQPISKNVSGWVSQFGELRGLEGIKPRRRVELLPYAVASAERFEQELGNPFRDGSASAVSFGMDGKVGVTSDLTLDFTVNPDFGQVEADPSEVNLTAFESFFPEKRPFFIEGSDIFGVRLAPATTGGDFVRDLLFYSRRIGGPPSHSPDLDDDQYVQEPRHASILAAGKLSGKTAGGLSIGVLDSLTSRESAELDTGGVRHSEVVEPRTNYFVGRLQQDLRCGDTQLGLMLTSVHRDIDGPPLDSLPNRALAAGLDFSHYFHDRDYRIEASAQGSQIRGSEAAILEAQESSARYFQRPDNDYVTLDPTRTSLGGHAGSLRLSRTSNSPFVFQSGVAWRSPGFEINDIGFMRSADAVNQFTWAAYQFRNAFGTFRNLSINANQWLDWDSGGHFLRAAANTNAHATFLNNYGVGGGVTWEGERVSNVELRGGPSSAWPGGARVRGVRVLGQAQAAQPVCWDVGKKRTAGERDLTVPLDGPSLSADECSEPDAQPLAHPHPARDAVRGDDGSRGGGPLRVRQPRPADGIADLSDGPVDHSQPDVPVLRSSVRLFGKLPQLQAHHVPARRTLPRQLRDLRQPADQLRRRGAGVSRRRESRRERRLQLRAA